MSRDRQRGFAVSLLIPGLLVLIMGLGGGGWTAYGQSAGPPPPPEVPPAVGGVEGEAPAGGRPEAVAGESEVAQDAPAEAAQPAPAVVAQPAGGEIVAGESGVSDATVAGTPSLIANTGAESGAQWSLLLVGMLLLAGGGLMFTRARKAQ